MGKLSTDNKKLPLAICGLGRFANRRVMPAVACCSNLELTAIVTHSGMNLETTFKIQKFLSLDDFLRTNPSGAVYITSPNSLHFEQTIKCLEAGLHVLCEKPMALNSTDCQAMIKTARDLNLFLKVGHMLRYSPALLSARQWLIEGNIGQHLSIRMIFHYELPESNRKWAFGKGSAGGGALMDAGVHCIDVIHLLTGSSLKVSSVSMDGYNYEDGVERSVQCHLYAGSCSCLIDINSHAVYKTQLTIVGTKGEIVIDNFAACWGNIAVKLYSNNRRSLLREEFFDASKIYINQLTDFANVIHNKNLDFPQDFIAAQNIKVIEEISSVPTFSHRGLVS